MLTCRHRRACLLIGPLLAALVVAGGCAGYRIGASSIYPIDVRTVYVPMFESDSLRRNLGERLTEAVCKEIERRTPYKVVSSSSADSILTGRITTDAKRVLIENRFDDPRQLEVSLQVQVSWVNRKGDLIREAGAIPVPAAVVTVDQSSDFVPEFGQSIATAHQEAIQRLARQIVDLMEQPW